MSTPEVVVERNVVVGTGGGRDLHADVYRPADGNRAGVLMIHGGGWRMGSKDMMPPQATALARAGFTCAAIEYRLTPEAAWPAQIHDVKAALRWVRANADALAVDPDKIAVSGNSAGGHLALLLAGTVGQPDFEGEGGNPAVDTSVAAVVAVYPPVLFHIGERPSGANAATALLGADPGPAEAAAASPIETVHRDFPPTFFLHGNADRVVPVTASLNMYRRLSEVGARAEMHIYAEQPHGWARWPAWVEPTMAEAAVFLDRYVVAPERYAPPDNAGG